MMGKDENKNLMTIVALPYVWYQESSKEIIFFKENVLFICINSKFHPVKSRGPRIMQCVMNTIPANAIEPGGVAHT